MEMNNNNINPRAKLLFNNTNFVVLEYTYISIFHYMFDYLANPIVQIFLIKSSTPKAWKTKK